MKKKTAIALTIVLCLILSFGGCGKESRTYKQAEKLLASSEYAQASELFLSLGDYKDAVDRASECKYQLAQSYLDADKPQILEAVHIYEELGDYKDTKSKLETLKKKYFYPDYDYRIPALECILTGATHTTSSDYSEENGPFHQYSYEWTFSDSYSSASILSEKYTEWLSYIDQNVDGLRTREKGKGTYAIDLDGVNVGNVLAGMGRGLVRLEVIIFEK